MTIGLFLLTIGTSLGAIWANESWGSYWSWDPKETWALISIMVYVFILHMRLIPSLRGKYIFNVFSFLSILSILITYFGVNYYLSGLHSYAKGNDLFVSKIFIILLILIIIIIIFSSYKRRS